MLDQIRAAEPAEIERLARLWHDGWRRAHAHLVPPALARFRTLESFTTRLEQALPRARVAGPRGAPVGLCLVKDDEVDQLYVALEAQGTGAAAALLADAEARMRDAGVLTAWLACAIGNDRAVRFYEKHGWRRAGTFIRHAETSAGSFDLETWRFEKVLQNATT